MAACLPSLILAVILAFVLSGVSRQGHEVAAATSGVHARGEVGNAKVVSPDASSGKGASADLQAADGSKSVATLLESHKRITDPDALAVVDGLSRYEIRALRWQAERGDDSAALTMGMLYETGRYVAQSCSQASEWVTRSANWGNAAAEYNLGLRYREGDGVPADEHEAEQWLQKAADQNYSQAAAALKEMASRGF